MTFDFVIKGPVMPLFKACNLGTPTFAPGLGTARKADHLQRPHTRPALRHRLAPARQGSLSFSTFTMWKSHKHPGQEKQKAETGKERTATASEENKRSGR